MTAIAKTILFLSALLPALCASERAEASVQFDYILEIHGMHDAGASHILNQIDSTILGELQDKLSQEASSDPDGEPTIFFEEVDSDIDGKCTFTTESDECALVRSTLLVSYEKETSQRTIEFETLQLVKSFLAGFSSRFSNVRSTYTFPRMEQSVATFTIDGMSQTLNTTEIEILEQTILQVFGDTLFSVGGDTDILDAKYIYQEHKEGKLDTHVMLTGVCRTCTSDSFGAIVDVVVDSTLDQFQENLKENAKAAGSDTFENAASVEYSTPEDPQFLDSLDEDIFLEAHLSETKHPWFLWLGVAVIIAMLISGLCLLQKEMKLLKKGDSKVEYTGDTSDSSDDDDGMEDVELDNYNTHQRFNAGDIRAETTSNPWLV